MALWGAAIQGSSLGSGLCGRLTQRRGFWQRQGGFGCHTVLFFPAALSLQNEKDSLVLELEAAREQLAKSEAAAVDTAHLSGTQRAQLEAQLEDARQAVAAAQAAANAAQQRAADASRELTAIRRQLSEAQAQLAGVQAAQRAAQEQAQAQQASAPTPMATLRGQLSDVHDSLAQLHAEHRAGRLHAATPELDKVGQAAGLAVACAQLVPWQACLLVLHAQLLSRHTLSS